VAGRGITTNRKEQDMTDKPMRAKCDGRYCQYCRKIVMTEAEFQKHRKNPAKSKRDPGCPECKKVGRDLSITTFLIATNGCELPADCVSDDVPGEAAGEE
jgi:hypothetical protein